MIASSNHLERLVSGISKRPRRFDQKYHFTLPNAMERARYCEHWRAKVHTAKIIFEPEMSKVVAQTTEGLSYAYLKELFVQSLLIVARASESGNDKPEPIGGSIGWRCSRGELPWQSTHACHQRSNGCHAS